MPLSATRNLVGRSWLFRITERSCDGLFRAVTEAMLTLDCVISTALLALCLGCGMAATSVPAPKAEAVGREVRNDSLALRGTATMISENYTDMKLVIEVKNLLSRPINLMVPGGCPVILQLMNAAPPSGRVVWDSQYAPSSLGCVLSLTHVRIGIGDSTRFGRGVTRAEVLGDSLPPGRYFVRGLLVIEPDRIGVEAGEIDIPK